MRFQVDARFPGRSPAEALRLVRDALPAIADELPNARSIDVLEASPALTRYRWHGKGEVPGPVRHLVRPEDLEWVDETRWDEAALAARSVVHGPGTRNVQVVTSVAFAPAEGGAEARFEGDVHVGLPLVGVLVERYVARRIEENLRVMAERLAAIPSFPPAVAASVPGDCTV